MLIQHPIYIVYDLLLINGHLVPPRLVLFAIFPWLLLRPFLHGVNQIAEIIVLLVPSRLLSRVVSLHAVAIQGTAIAAIALVVGAATRPLPAALAPPLVLRCNAGVVGLHL